MYKPWKNNSSKFVIDIQCSIGERPDAKTLDRINNNGNYEPGNLRWATVTEQKLNSSITNLTEDNIRDIRNKYKSGIMQTDIAKEYKMSNIQIWRIINNICWKEVV